jgi:hypothetical protein
MIRYYCHSYKSLQAEADQLCDLQDHSCGLQALTAGLRTYRRFVGIDSIDKLQGSCCMRTLPFTVCDTVL